VPSIPSCTLPDLVREGVLDAELAALCWLVVEGGVPLVVTGAVDPSARRQVADALIHLPPDGPALIVDLDAGRPTVASLAGFMRGGMRLAAISPAHLVSRSSSRRPAHPPTDCPRTPSAPGLVLVLGDVPSVAPGPMVDRLRVVSAHYLRPLERDAGGHVQRRPPAVLATWAQADDAFDHFAWGLTPELADRIDRSQASFEELQDARAAALAALADGVSGAPDLRTILAAEPPRVPAPPRPAAVPSPLHSPLTDPHIH